MFVDLLRCLKFHFSTMVHRPGTSGDMGFTVSPTKKKRCSVMDDQGATKTLEAGSPVIKMDEGSKDLQILVGCSAIEVKMDTKKNPKILPLLSSLKKTPWAIVISMIQSLGLTAKAEKHCDTKQVAYTTAQNPRVPKKKEKTYQDEGINGRQRDREIRRRPRHLQYGLD